MQNDRTQLFMGAAGLALVFGFFMPWIDILGVVDASGWDLVREEHISISTRLVLGLCPIAGIALALAGFGKSRSAARLSMLTGLAVLGYTGYKVAYAFAKVTGWGLWMILAAAFIALILGLTGKRGSV